MCDLSTDAIIGTDILGSVLPHTLDIKHWLLFTEGSVSLQLHRRDAALSGRVFTARFHHIQRQFFTVPTRTVGGRSMSSSELLEGFLREHRPGSGPDTGGPIGMEGASADFKFWIGDRDGGAFCWTFKGPA